MATISAVILTKNEASCIERCLTSLLFCDEILIIDSGSTDSTAAICQRFRTRFLVHLFEDFAKQRQFGAEQATSDWVLYIDADEVVPVVLGNELLRLKNELHLGTIVFPRKNQFMGHWIRYGGWYPDWQRRMLRRDKVRFTDKSVHELPELIPVVYSLSDEWTGELAIEHYTYRSLEHYLHKINQCSTLEAHEYQDVLRTRKRDVLARSFGMFWQCYWAKKAYKDGLPGFVIAIIQLINSLMIMIKIIEIKRETSD